MKDSTLNPELFPLLRDVLNERGLQPATLIAQNVVQHGIQNTGEVFKHWLVLAVDTCHARLEEKIRIDTIWADLKSLAGASGNERLPATPRTRKRRSRNRYVVRLRDDIRRGGKSNHRPLAVHR